MRDDTQFTQEERYQIEPPLKRGHHRSTQFQYLLQVNQDRPLHHKNHRFPFADDHLNGNLQF
jgi:hypothetical protein